MFSSEKFIESYKTQVSENWRSNIFSLYSLKNENNEDIYQIYLDGLVVSEVIYSLDEAREWIYKKLIQIIKAKNSKLKLEIKLLENDLTLTKESFMKKYIL